jgi:hypothetical protein
VQGLGDELANLAEAGGYHAALAGQSFPAYVASTVNGAKFRVKYEWAARPALLSMICGKLFFGYFIFFLFLYEAPIS